VKPTFLLPDDAGLDGLRAIREQGLARAVPELHLADETAQVQLVGYSRGLRATLEVRAGDRHFTVKCFARDPSAEADLYATLAKAGLASEDSGIRVPRLLAFERRLKMVAISWLEGSSGSDLIVGGDGARAGDLAARWIERSATLEANVRRAAGSGEVLSRAGHWNSALAAADASLGVLAEALTRRLAATLQVEPSVRLVNGRFYLRHVLDLGDAAGVIDWSDFGCGCLEIDAGMFLASLWRTRRHKSRAREAARAEDVFLGRTASLLDERRLAWYRSGALMSLAYHCLARRRDDWLDRAGDFLTEAAQSLDAAIPPPRALRRPAHGVAPRPDILEQRGGGRVTPEHPIGGRGVEESLDDVIARLDDAQRFIVGDLASLADELFQGDTVALVCQLISARDLSAKDLARVIALLQERQREMEGLNP